MRDILRPPFSAERSQGLGRLRRSPGWSLLLLALLGLSCAEERTPVREWVPEDDTRQVVTVNAVQRESIRRVMRENMESLQRVLVAAGTDNLEEVHRLASLAANTPGPGRVEPSLRPLLPEGWRAHGKQVHSSWQSLAKVTKQQIPASQVATAVAQITAVCVACHAQYRLETR